jgi:hypothetical protein
MTDRELLEAAAKALNGQARFDISPDKAPWLQGVVAGGPQPYPVRWNPLTDDGDALRLAVDLGMVIDTDYNGGVIAGNAAISLDEPEYGYQEGMGKKDLHAATRRAIVRVAAEVGRKKK